MTPNSATEAWLEPTRRGWEPEPLLTVSEWADEHRVLSGKGSAEPGRWRTSRTPYLTEIMDSLSPLHPAQRIVLMKGAQIGATECGNNWIGYLIHRAPGPVLYVEPTVEVAKRVSKQRIAPMIASTPALRARVAPSRSRDSGNTMFVKEFDGGLLILTGANSGSGLRSMPIRNLSELLDGRLVLLADGQKVLISGGKLFRELGDPPLVGRLRTGGAALSPVRGAWRGVGEVLAIFEEQDEMMASLPLGGPEGDHLEADFPDSFHHLEAQAVRLHRATGLHSTLHRAAERGGQPFPRHLEEVEARRARC